MALDNIYTPALMVHNAHPEYKYELEDPDASHRGVNPSCGDDITLAMNFDGDVVDEAAFSGSGCAVSQASTDLMADLITERPLDEARELCELFLRMIRGEVEDDAELERLGDAACLKDIAHMPSRVKCAELGWRTALEMIEQRGKSTVA